MELRQLQAFVAIADEGHFGRAAARLHLTQPPLTQRLQALEAGLGVRLLQRGRGGVSLTAAGTALLPQARALLEQVQRAAELARRAGTGAQGALALAFAGSMPFTEVMPRLLRDFRRRWPAVELQLREQPSRLQIDELLASRLDVGFIRATEHEGLAALATRVLLREPLRAALHVEHPLARRRRLQLSELRDEPFVLYSAALGSGLRERTLALCLQAGFTPRVVQEVHEMPTLVGLVGAGLGIGLVAASMQRASVPDVHYASLRDADAHSDILLAWRRDNDSPVLANFLALAR